MNRLKCAVLLIGAIIGAIAHAKAFLREKTSKDVKCVQVGAYKGLPSSERKTLEDVNCEQRRKLLNSAAATQNRQQCRLTICLELDELTNSEYQYQYQTTRSK